MSSYSQSIANLMTELSKLPGIGMRSAERIAFHLLKQKPEEAMRLADAIRDVKTRIKHCSVCYNLTEQDPCAIVRIRVGTKRSCALSSSPRICWRWKRRACTRGCITC